MLILSEEKRLLNPKMAEKKFRQKIAVLPFYDSSSTVSLQRNLGVL